MTSHEYLLAKCGESRSQVQAHLMEAKARFLQPAARWVREHPVLAATIAVSAGGLLFALLRLRRAAPVQHYGPQARRNSALRAAMREGARAAWSGAWRLVGAGALGAIFARQVDQHQPDAAVIRVEPARCDRPDGPTESTDGVVI